MCKKIMKYQFTQIKLITFWSFLHNYPLCLTLHGAKYSKEEIEKMYSFSRCLIPNQLINEEHHKQFIMSKNIHCTQHQVERINKLTNNKKRVIVSVFVYTHLSVTVRAWGRGVFSAVSWKLWPCQQIRWRLAVSFHQRGTQGSHGSLKHHRTS